VFKRWNRASPPTPGACWASREAAGDTAQEAWAEIVRGLGGLADISAFPAWAYRIVSRRCAKAIGRNVRDRRAAEALAAEPEESGEAPTSDRHRLRQAIDALPAEQRSAIALFYLEDMSVAEVAVALNVPAGTVKTRLMHARHKLRAALEGAE
jgi:RNA polymerase sigma-70 factor (ECF subfamily)